MNAATSTLEFAFPLSRISKSIFTLAMCRASETMLSFHDDERTPFLKDRVLVSAQREIPVSAKLIVWCILFLSFWFVVEWPHLHSFRLVETRDSSYRRVQFLGFQIYTGGAPAFLDNNGTELNPECVGLESYGEMETDTTPELQCYMGLEDPSQDVNERLRIMKTAVEQAYQTAAHDPEVLKVFVAPEFYFRGVNGAYRFGDEKVGDTNICGPICELLRELQGFVANPKYKDWLFLFGTIIAYENLPQSDPYDYLIYNFAPVYKGYDPKEIGEDVYSAKRFLLPKRFVSSSDFLTPRSVNTSSYQELFAKDRISKTTTVDSPFDDMRKRYNDNVFHDYKHELGQMGYTMIEYDWLVVDEISVSLEICFDHQMATALQTYIGDAATGGRTLIPVSSNEPLWYTRIPTDMAQISLVSSAGMTIVPESLVLQHDGIAFLQDGLSNETMRKYWEAASPDCDSSPTGLQFDGGTEAVQRHVKLSSTDIRFSHTPLESTRFNVYDEKWPEYIQPLFSSKKYPPQIVQFEPIAFPGVPRTPS